MMRWIIVGIALLLSLSCTFAQGESGVAEELTSQNADLDHLTSQMIPELSKLLPSDSSLAALELEQAMWQEARSKDCRQEARGYPRKQRRQRELQCRYDTGIRRLEELLIRYDELAPK